MERTSVEERERFLLCEEAEEGNVKEGRGGGIFV